MQTSALALFVLLLPISCQACPESGPCVPPAGNLLVGREQRLFASSTCGLRYMERYCFRDEGKNKCLYCSTTSTYAHDATRHHAISNVVPRPETSHKWWQSQTGLSNVSIIINPESLFRVESLTIGFKFEVPRGVDIQVSKNFAKSWTTVISMTSGCISEKVSCIGNNITFKLQAELTSIQILLSGASSSDGAAHSFFAISRMDLQGSCLCHGHAGECKQTGAQVAGMVGSECVCQHNTKGSNCEECRDLFNDRPWQPNLVCHKCSCNNRSDECNFDQLLYDQSGLESGGMCLNCIDNWIGKSCDSCRPAFFRADGRCSPCGCSVAGSISSRCHQQTGVCSCKPGFSGKQCNTQAAERSWDGSGVIQSQGEKIEFEFKIKNLRTLVRLLNSL